MFDRTWLGYPFPSLIECLVVFAILFLAGSLWTFLLWRYVDFLMEEDADA